MAAIELIFFCFLLLSKSARSDVICEVGFCEEYLRDPGCTAATEECASNNATHTTGMWLPSPTTCNCCEFCLPLYGENEHCSLGGPGLGTTVGRCGPGLTCVADPSDGYSYCQRITSTCHTAQTTYDTRHNNGQTGALEERPLCDGKGKYGPFVCVPAHTCFCQDEDGERIFGEALYTGNNIAQTMHCGCSRLHEQIKKYISPGVPYPVVGPRCTLDGNYHPIQCIGRDCYCVDRYTGTVLEGEGREINLDERPVSALICYDPDLDLYPHQNIGPPPYEYHTPCMNEFQTKLDLILQSQREGYNVDYFTSTTECMPDGTYGLIAEGVNGTKICVDQHGNQINDYKAEPGTAEYDSMDCKCAQTNIIMKDSAEQPVCCKNGNFRTIQCRRGLCRCVDSDGKQTVQETSTITSLSCYTANWRNC